MSKITLPENLNDGTSDYELVRPEKELGGGLSEVALYERVPKDVDFQYTPDLAFCQGQTETPIMQPIARGADPAV